MRSRKQPHKGFAGCVDETVVRVAFRSSATTEADVIRGPGLVSARRSSGRSVELPVLACAALTWGTGARRRKRSRPSRRAHAFGDALQPRS